MSWALRRRLVLLTTVAVAVIGASVALLASRQQPFPHDRHAHLFPLCAGCHEGIESGDRAMSFPPPALCASCHDGVVEERVTWTGPAEHLTNLQFTHPSHDSAVTRAGGAQLDCGACHTPVDAPRMTVVRADPSVCLACHEHQANDHYVDAPCRTCHVPFVESELPPSQLATLPVPEGHRETEFLLAGHGAQAERDITRCAVCHTRERCVSCHVNAGAVPAIAQVPVAPAGWALPQYAVAYPLPSSHLEPEWVEHHGGDAGPAQCAACHTRDDCAACHVPPLPRAADALPARAQVAAPGAGLEREMPASHASRFFERDHAALAASEPASCAACHTKNYCADCHEAPTTPSYHPRNFALQHSSAAYGRRLECSTCHETRTFCRSCHIQQGMQAEGRLNPGFHDAEPLWLLRHARAARQGLESCTTCHTQRDCLQCHSQLGAFQVNPHGPDFDARRAQQRNALICFACHVTDPLRGGTEP